MKKYTTRNFYMDGTETIHISKGNTKLGNGIYNLSLLPTDDVLKYSDGTPVTNLTGTCQGCCEQCKKYCYAKKCVIMYKITLKAWAENTMLARNDIDRFFNLLDHYFALNIISVFRIHVGGEFFSEEYFCRWISFAKYHTETKFYFYTKRYEWLNTYADEIPVNMTPIVSPEGKDFNNPHHFFEFIVDDGTDEEIAKLPHCPAVDSTGHETGITCSQCRRCINGKRGDKVACYKH